MLQHWRRHEEWSSDAARIADAHEAMRLAGRDVAPFHLETSLDAALGRMREPTTFARLREDPNLGARTEAMDVVVRMRPGCFER